MEGDIRTDIIRDPENYADMKKKYLEREDERLQAVLERRKAETTQELSDIASKAIVKRALRAGTEHKPLKDTTIIRDPKSEEIQNLRKELAQEVSALGQRILNPPRSQQ